MNESTEPKPRKKSEFMLLGIQSKKDDVPTYEQLGIFESHQIAKEKMKLLYGAGGEFLIVTIRSRHKGVISNEVKWTGS